MPARVLIIDDDEASREAMRDQLERAGYDVFVHRSAREITGAMIRALRPGLVLCGLDLPGVAPELFAPLMQQLRGALGVRTLLISDRPADEIEARAAAIGADGWFEKSRLFRDAQGAVQEALAQEIEQTRKLPLVLSGPQGPSSVLAAVEERLPVDSPARQEPRVRLGVPCRGTHEDSEFTGTVLDLSTGGLCVATDAQLTPGGRVTIDFELPTGPAIRAETQLVWVRPPAGGGPPGFGLRFGFLLPEDREAIEAVVRAAFPDLFE